MKSRFFAVAAILSLIAFQEASAEERKLDGELTVLGQILDFKGEKAKFNEYRDIRGGATGAFDVQYERGNYYLDLSGEEVGRRDQEYRLSGGKWGSFGYDFWYDQIPHNFTTNAKTFYTGRGSANLTYTPVPPTGFTPNLNISTWDTFDYSVDRKNYGAGFKLDMLKPFFAGVSFNREERSGVYPLGIAGTSPGGISIELPMPIDYVTDVVRLEAGYIKNPLSLTFGYTYGQFDNNNNADLNFRNPATANTAATMDTYTLPADNDYYKYDFKGALRLPWNSKFNANLSYARNESSRNLLNSYVTDTSAAASNIGVRGRTGIILSDYVFDGKVDIQNYNFVLTTNPVHYLDGKVFYKYYQTNNKSSHITSIDPGPTPAGVTPTVLSNEEDLFDYLTYRFGGQVGLRLPMSFYLIGEYTRVHTSRKRFDVPENDDDIYGAELRWSGVDFMVARVGYERLQRYANFETPAVTGPTDINNIEPFISRFDVAERVQDTVKASVDLFPLEDLNINLGYRWRQTRYNDTILGLRNWWGNEYHVDADYLFYKRVKLFGYFDFEYAKLDQFQRTFPSGTAGVFNPALPPTTTAFNWTVTETDYNWGVGAGTDIYAVPKKLTLRLQYSYVKSRGAADYTYLRAFVPADLGRTQDNIDIDNLDNYRLTYYLAKVTYTPVKPLSVSVGWMYEKYILDDAQLNGYQYIARSSTGAILSFLSGAYANQNYRANVWFGSVSYLF